MLREIETIFRDIAEKIQRHPKEFILGCGVPADLIHKAEAALSVRFPPSFRRYLLEYGCGSIGGEELYGLAGTAALGIEFEDACGAGDIVFETLNDRGNLGIPKSWISLVNNDGDELFYLDTSVMDERGENPVLLRRIEDRDHPVRYADSFCEYLLKRVRFRFG